MNLPDIWASLERDAQTGYVTRRVPHEHRPFDLRLAVISPGRARALLMRLHGEPPALGDLKESTGFSLDAVTLPDELPDTYTLELRLSSAAYSDVFDALLTDVVARVVSSSTEAEAAAALLDQIQRWQRFLSRSAPEGLSRSQQVGLYGELRALIHVIAPAVGTADAIAAWTGPSGTSQDFQLHGSALEVKTTTAKQPQHVRITSERQLDSTGIEALYLSHFSLDDRAGSGETLPDLVASVRDLASDSNATDALEERLFNSGYIDQHAHRYDEIGYTPRRSRVFRVTTDFPRIVEKHLGAGVGDVHYSIELSACEPFESDLPVLQADLRERAR